MRTRRVVHYVARHGTLHTLYPDEIHLDHIREADVCTHPPDKIVDPLKLTRWCRNMWELIPRTVFYGFYFIVLY